MPPEPSPAPRTILVVDDSATVRLEVAAMLRTAGFEVTAVSDGRAAIWQLWGSRPDLVLCDLMMPEMDGFAVLEAMRERPDWATIPYVCLTSHGERQLMRQAMERGADDYVQKPVSATELVAAVSAALEKRARVARETQQRLQDLRQSISLALPHEFRTPLTAMIGYSDLLLETARQRGDDELVTLAAGAAAAAARLHRLTENFLLYAQLELGVQDDTGGIRLEVADPVPLDTIAASVAAERAQELQRQADLSCDLRPAPVYVAERIVRKIVSEVIENAFKFSKPGSPVTIRVQHESGHSVLTVTDRGVGMTIDEVTLLGAYVQVDRGNREQQGLGLGVAIVRRVVERAGGRLIVESEAGEGTSVTLFLPAVHTIG